MCFHTKKIALSIIKKELTELFYCTINCKTKNTFHKKAKEKNQPLSAFLFLYLHKPSSKYFAYKSISGVYPRGLANIFPLLSNKI